MKIPPEKWGWYRNFRSKAIPWIPGDVIHAFTKIVLRTPTPLINPNMSVCMFESSHIHSSLIQPPICVPYTLQIQFHSRCILFFSGPFSQADRPHSLPDIVSGSTPFHLHSVTPPAVECNWLKNLYPLPTVFQLSLSLSPSVWSGCLQMNNNVLPTLLSGWWCTLKETSERPRQERSNKAAMNTCQNAWPSSSVTPCTNCQPSWVNQSQYTQKKREKGTQRIHPRWNRVKWAKQRRGNKIEHPIWLASL